MISIIIPVYNQAKKLDKCLESVKKQTYDNYEIIIINDGSTDEIEEVIKKYKLKFGSKLEYFSQKNKGAPSARNSGFEKSKGEYLLFCDADAVLKTDALKLMLEALERNPKASYAYSSFLWGRKLFKLHSFDADKLKKMPYIHTISLIKREHFPKNKWDESIKKLQDWDLWLTMLKDGHIGVWINKTLFAIRPGGVYSSWVPKIAYKILPFLPQVKKYKKAIEIIKKKHGIMK